MNTDLPQGPSHSGSDHASDELIATYLDGEATEAERHAISGHLPGCGDCETRLEQQQEIVTLLKALPAVPAPRSFAIPAEATNPALAWFQWMRAGAAFATFAFVALFAFNMVYVATDALHMELAISEQAVQLESEAMSGMVEAPAPSDAQSAPSAKRAAESESAAEPTEPAAAEMAEVRFDAPSSPVSPVAGYEWIVLAVAIVLSVSTLGIWLLRIRR